MQSCELFPCSLMPRAPLSMSPSQLKTTSFMSAIRMDGLHLQLPCDILLHTCIKPKPFLFFGFHINNHSLSSL